MGKRYVMNEADEAKLLLADHHLRVCERSGLLICSRKNEKCGIAVKVDRKAVGHHLRSYHGTGTVVTKAVVIAASRLSASPQSVELQKRYMEGGSGHGPLPRLEGLPVMSSKQCLVCDRMFVKDITLRSHLSKEHKLAKSLYELQGLAALPSQSLGKKAPKLRPFPIAEVVVDKDSEEEYDPGALVAGDDKEVEDMFQGVFPSAARVQERLALSGLQLKEAGWLVGYRSEWNEEAFGKKMKDVKNCIRDCFDEARRLCQSSKVTSNFYSLIQTGSATRKDRKFKFLGVHKVSEEARKQGKVPGDTLQRYTDSLALVVRIALLVVTHHVELKGVYMSQVIKEAAKKVLHKDLESDEEEFADAVFQLVFSVFTEKKKDDSPDGKVLFSFIVLACLCVQLDNQRIAKLCDSKAVGSRLSGILYGASCVFAVHVLKYHAEGGGNEAAKKMIKDITDPSAEYGLSYFTDLRSLCSTLRSSEARSNPFTICRKHVLCGFFHGKEFSAAEYGQSVKEMHRAIRKKMFKKLFNGKELPEKFWSKIMSLAEDTGKADVGYWALSDVRNAEFLKTCVQWARSAADVKGLRVHGWFSWKKRALDVLLEILTAGHISGGGPGRGTEIGSLTLRNTRFGMRTVFLPEDEVMMMPFYNKTRSMRQGKVMVLTRHLDRETSALFRAFFVLAHPLLVREEEKQLGEKPQDPVRNVRDCLTLGAWSAGDMAHSIGRKMTRYGIPFGFREFRQHQRGLAKTKKSTSVLRVISAACEAEEDIQDRKDGPGTVGEAAVEQAGHSQRTADLMYAQMGKSGRLDIEKEENKIELFRKASEEWHVDLGLREGTASAMGPASLRTERGSKKTSVWRGSSTEPGESRAADDAAEEVRSRTVGEPEKKETKEKKISSASDVCGDKASGQSGRKGSGEEKQSTDQLSEVAEPEDTLAKLLEQNPRLRKVLASTPKAELESCVQNLQSGRTVLERPSTSGISRQAASDEEAVEEDARVAEMDELPLVEPNQPVVQEKTARAGRSETETEVRTSARTVFAGRGAAPCPSPETARSGHRFPQAIREEVSADCSRAARGEIIVPSRLKFPEPEDEETRGALMSRTGKTSEVWERFRNVGRRSAGSWQPLGSMQKTFPSERICAQEIGAATPSPRPVKERREIAGTLRRDLGAAVCKTSEESITAPAEHTASASRGAVDGPKRPIMKGIRGKVAQKRLKEVISRGLSIGEDCDGKGMQENKKIASPQGVPGVNDRIALWEDVDALLAPGGSGSVREVVDEIVSTVPAVHMARTHGETFNALQALQQVTNKNAVFKSETQRKAMEAVARRRGDLAVILKTGEGKTAVVMGPVTRERGVTVWVCPLRALRWETKRRLQGGRLEVFGCDDVPIARVEKGMGMVCLVSPEEMVRPEFGEMMRCLHKRNCLNRVVVDEVHLAVMSESYRKCFAHLKAAAKHGTMCPIVMLTATAPPEMLSKISAVCGSDMKGLEEHRGDPCRPELKVTVVSCPYWRTKKDMGCAVASEVMGLQLDLAKGRGACARCVVVCLTTQDADEVGEIVRETVRQADVTVYHSKRDAWARESAMRRWQNALEKGKLRVVVATEGFTTGTDAGGVRLVVFAGGSRSLVEFWQAAGRGARDGGVAEVVVFYNKTMVCKAIGEVDGVGGEGAGVFPAWAEDGGTCRRVGVERCLTGADAPTCQDRQGWGTDVQFCDVCEMSTSGSGKRRSTMSYESYMSRIAKVKRPSDVDLMKARAKQVKRARRALGNKQWLRRTGNNLSKVCLDHLLELYMPSKQVSYANQDSKTLLEKSMACSKRCQWKERRCFRCHSSGHQSSKCPVLESITKDARTGVTTGGGKCRECRLSALLGENPHECNEFGRKDGCPLKPCLDLMLIAWNKEKIREQMRHPERGIQWGATLETAEEGRYAERSNQGLNESRSPSSLKEFAEWLTEENADKVAGICTGLQWLLSHLAVDVGKLEL